MSRFPAKIPAVPSFVDPSALPPIRLASGAGALPADATTAFCTMLSFSDPASPYAGIHQVVEACDATSLARFSWGLFEAWLSAGAPSKQDWACKAMGTFGDDDCARKLTPLVRAWPGEAAHARAVIGLEVLAGIGTDVALMHLNGIAQKLQFKGLQEQARQRIQEIADKRGLTTDELGDRLVPDLGLNQDGSLALDYGPRSFTVGFDEHLKPFVRDAAGKPLKNLPKPGKRDDQDQAPAAFERFKALKKDARAVAKQQIVRLELAMCGRRRWTTEVFRSLLVDHPLLIHVVRRLLWGTYENGTLVTSFRVAEDRSLTNASDDETTLTDQAAVGIPHVLDLSQETSAAWGELFGDYELLQPFQQLGRDAYRPDADELTRTAILRFAGQQVATGAVMGLQAKGWLRGAAEDAGIVSCMEKPLPDGQVAVLDLDPGLATGAFDVFPEQTLGVIKVDVATLDPVVFSELVRDLHGVTG